MDPHAENYYNISPYVYCHNNPIRLVDPDGRDDKDKVEVKLPNISDIVHRVLASFGLDIQVPKGDTQVAAKDAEAHNTQQAETRNEIKDNLKQEARNTADNLETGGTTMQAGGYVLAPVTAGESLWIVPIGKTVESTGSLINLALDLSEGKTGKATVNMATTLVFGQAGKKVKSLENAGKIAKSESTLLQLITDVHEKITNFCVNFISDKK